MPGRRRPHPLPEVELQRQAGNVRSVLSSGGLPHR